MKKVIIILLFITAVPAFSAEQPAKVALTKFEFFQQLPKDVQALILGAIYPEWLKEGNPTFEAGIQELSRLRLINREAKNLIDDPVRGKALINAIYAKYNTYNALKIGPGPGRVVRILISQNLPSSWAWLKEQAAIDPDIKAALSDSLEGIIRDFDGADAEQKLQRAIEAGADINERDYTGRTPLMIAIDKKKNYLAELLIKLGADVNAKDKSGGTAITWAQEAQNHPGLLLLRAAGAK